MKTYRTVAERYAAVDAARQEERRRWAAFAAIPATDHEGIARAYAAWGRANAAYRAVRVEEWRVPNVAGGVPA